LKPKSKKRDYGQEKIRWRLGQIEIFIDKVLQKKIHLTLKKKTDKMPTHKAYTFASRTSPVTNQSLQKSMLSPTLRKNKKITSLKKNKTLPTLNPTDRKRMKETVDKQNGMSLDKKEGQLVTGGIFYCRDSAGFSVSATNKLSCNLTVHYFEIGNKNIPSKR